jgi:hypothetical protein
VSESRRRPKFVAAFAAHSCAIAVTDHDLYPRALSTASEA